MDILLVFFVSVIVFLSGMYIGCGCGCRKLRRLAEQEQRRVRYSKEIETIKYF